MGNEKGKKHINSRQKKLLKKQQRRAIKSRLLFAISSMETRAPREAAAIKTDKCWLGPFP